MWHFRWRSTNAIPLDFARILFCAGPSFATASMILSDATFRTRFRKHWPPLFGLLLGGTVLRDSVQSAIDPMIPVPSDP